MTGATVFATADVTAIPYPEVMAVSMTYTVFDMRRLTGTQNSVHLLQDLGTILRMDMFEPVFYVISHLLTGNSEHPPTLIGPMETPPRVIQFIYDPAESLG
jgi:hypothetical protein